MMNEAFLVPPQERPSWLEYPHSFCRLVEQGLIHMTPWHILTAEKAQERFRGLRTRYPSRALFPFAYRQDNDDVACWAEGLGEQVFIIHDFTDPGYEDEGHFENVWSWFRSAIDETIDWD
jgi:hypothetical protein